MNQQLDRNITGHLENLTRQYNDEVQQIVAFAAKLCSSSFASIILTDKNFQWVQSKKVRISSETLHELSNLAYDGHKDHALIVGDTKSHSKFCNHPTIIELKIRCFVAVPLITHQRHRIGTLLIMDHKTHEPSNHEKLIFKIIANHVITLIELKSSLDTLDENFNQLKVEREYRLKSEIRLRSMFESLTDSYFLLGVDSEILDFNRTAYLNVKENFGEKLSRGRLMTDFLLPSYQNQFACYFNCALQGEKTNVERQADFGKGKVWLECVFGPVSSDKGDIMGVSYVARDITARKISEAKIVEQNRLLCRIAEIQSHDYRSPVASILGLMSLIESENYQPPREYLVMLQEAVKKLDEKIHDVVNLVNISG